MAELANPRHERFAREYLVDLVAGRAYERAGYKARGHVADSAGGRLLTKVDVVARIAELKEERVERVQIEADTVLREQLLLATSSVNHYTVDEDGRIVLTDDAPDGAVRAVSSVKIKTTTYTRGDQDTKEVTTEYRLWNKNTALDSLMKHLGLNEADNAQKTPSAVAWLVRTPGDDG